MANPKLHKFLTGGWNAMSRTDTQIYYDGAWHDPCSGSKTLWHFQDGAWHKFPCAVSDRILFSAYPQDFSSIAFVGLLNSDGSVFSENGQTVLPLTTSEHGFGGERDVRGFSYSRDYSTIYGDRFPGLVSFGNNVHHDRFLEPNGGPDGPWVSFGWPETATLPLDITFEVAGDGGFKWLMYDNSTRIPNQMLFSVAFAFFSWLDIGLFSDNLTDRANPDGWSLNYHAGVGHGELCRFYGGVEEDRWHTIGVRLPATGNMKLLVDGTEIDAGVTPFNNQVDSVSAGIMGPNRAGTPVNGINGGGGGWYYIGEIRVGSRPFGCEYLRYAYWNAGYPWQYPFDTSEPFYRLPDMEFSPDGTERHAYVEIQNGDIFDSDLTDYLSWSYPSLPGLPGIYTNPLSTPGSELWKLDQSGKRDVTLMNDNRTAPWPVPGERIIKVESYPPDFNRVEWENFNWQVSGNYGIDNGLISFREVAETYGNPISLYRISLDPGTLGDTTLVDSAYDYPFASGSVRYESPACGFTPSGNRIWILRDFSSTGAILSYCLRDGTDKQTVTIPNVGSVSTMNVGYIVFDPADETIFYYTGTNTLGTVYHGIWKGNFNGDPFELIYEIPGYGLHPSDPAFTGGTILAVDHFNRSDQYLDASSDWHSNDTSNADRLAVVSNNINSRPAISQAIDVSGFIDASTVGHGADVFVFLPYGGATFRAFQLNEAPAISILHQDAISSASGFPRFTGGYTLIFSNGTGFPTFYGNIKLYKTGSNGDPKGTLLYNSGNTVASGYTGFGLRAYGIAGGGIKVEVWIRSGFSTFPVFTYTDMSPLYTTGYGGLSYFGVSASPNLPALDDFFVTDVTFLPAGDPHTVNNPPKVSPDMARLAFLLGDDSTGNSDACSMLKDGTDFRQHTNGVYPGGTDAIREIGWSPDGTELGFWTFLFSSSDGSQGFGAIKIADDTQREIIAPSVMFQSFEVNNFQWFHGWQGE